MNVIFIHDSNLMARLDTLSYGEFREMVPVVDNDKHLPRPERLKNECIDERLLDVAFDDFTITVYQNGLFHYQEANRQTAYTVSGCAKLLYPSTTGQVSVEAEEAEKSLWYIPLMVAGSYRIENNMSKRENSVVKFHYEPGTVDRPTMPAEADHAEEAYQKAIEQERQENMRKLLKAASRNLTGRQEQVLWFLYGLNLTQCQTAEALGTTQANISAVLKNARKRLNKRVQKNFHS